MTATNDRSDVFKYVDMAGPDDCWRWSGPYGGRKRDPRPYFSAGGRRYVAYRLIYELVHGVELDSKQLLLHSCDNGAMPIGCCNPKHVRIGTVLENSADMTSRQRHGLSHSIVRNIRTLLERGRTQMEVAELYGVSRETVSAIATGRVYDHVERGNGDATGSSES